MAKTEKGIRAIVAQGERARKTLSTWRARERRQQTEMVSKALTLGGGAVAGLVDGLYASGPAEVAEIWGLPANAVVGGGLTVAAVLGGSSLPGGDILGSAGIGMATAALYTEARKRAAES